MNEIFEFLIASTTVFVANGIAVVAIIVPAYFAWRGLQRKQAEVHVLVNARLDKALNEIEVLQEEIERQNEVVSELQRRGLTR